MGETTFRSEGQGENGTWYVEIATSGDNRVEMSVGYSESVRRASVTHFTSAETRSFAEALEALAIAAESSGPHPPMKGPIRQRSPGRRRTSDHI